MDDPIRNRWDQWFRDEKSYETDINYTPWLERYSLLMQDLAAPFALDLGCGRGFDTRYLIDFGLRTISTDFSLGALYAARRTTPSSDLLQFDLREYFPFADQTFGLIVANLSLHYFSTLDTTRIIEELHRIMADDGWLIARVNSTSDHGFQLVKDDNQLRIDKDYYIYQRNPKRYFRESSIRQFFSKDWKIDIIEEKKLMRFEKTKVLWEFTAKKTSIIP